MNYRRITAVLSIIVIISLSANIVMVKQNAKQERNIQRLSEEVYQAIDKSIEKSLACLETILISEEEQLTESVQELGINLENLCVLVEMFNEVSNGEIETDVIYQIIEGTNKGLGIGDNIISIGESGTISAYERRFLQMLYEDLREIEGQIHIIKNEEYSSKRIAEIFNVSLDENQYNKMVYPSLYNESYE